MRKLQKAYANLRKSHKNIRKAFFEIDDALIEEFLGKYDSPRLRKSLKKYGCGHRLHGVPRSIEEMTNADVLVLIAGTSPKLGKSTDFSPTLPLPDMRYWRGDKRLRPQIRSERNGEEYRLHFMSWHQNFTIHGEDDAHARRNLNILSRNIANFQSLNEKEEKVSRKFVKECKSWLYKSERPMVLITNPARSQFYEPISGLLYDSNIIHIEANLRGKNYQIMGRIRDRLP